MAIPARHGEIGELRLEAAQLGAALVDGGGPVVDDAVGCGRRAPGIEGREQRDEIGMAARSLGRPVGLGGGLPRACRSDAERRRRGAPGQEHRDHQSSCTHVDLPSVSGRQMLGRRIIQNKTKNM